MVAQLLAEWESGVAIALAAMVAELARRAGPHQQTKSHDHPPVELDVQDRAGAQGQEDDWPAGIHHGDGSADRPVVSSRHHVSVSATTRGRYVTLLKQIDFHRRWLVAEPQPTTPSIE